MAGMILMPTESGLKQLKEHTKSALEKVELLDVHKKKFWETEIFTSFYDNKKILTALFDIPLAENITTSAYYINVVANGEVIASGKLTKPVAFVEGFGGTQTLKFPVTGEAGEIVFKNNNFITEEEFKERYLSSVLSIWELTSSIEKHILEKEIEDIEKSKQEKAELEEFKNSLLKEVNNITDKKIDFFTDEIKNINTKLSSMKSTIVDRYNIAYGSTGDTTIKQFPIKKGKYLFMCRLKRWDGGDVDDVGVYLYLSSGTYGGFPAEIGEYGHKRERTAGMYFIDIDEDAVCNISLRTDGDTHFNGSVDYVLVRLGV